MYEKAALCISAFALIISMTASLISVSQNKEILEQTKISNMYLRGSVPAAPTPTPEPLCQPTPPLVLR